jgi:hypothetical protein
MELRGGKKMGRELFMERLADAGVKSVSPAVDGDAVSHCASRKRRLLGRV